MTQAESDRTMGKGLKLKDGRFRLDLRKKFFTMRLERHWNGLLREIVDAQLLTLGVLKAELDGALSNLVPGKVSVPMAGGLERDVL